ncbi:MAG: hypothetical protein QOJ42_3885, partial [Acidobacteriaceae bacterium]|nr:hypothetical protein [Acidobacteriaceae bacterium]
MTSSIDSSSPCNVVITRDRQINLTPQQEAQRQPVGVGARGLPSTFDRPFGLRERQSRFIQKGLPCGCQLQWTSTPFDEPRTLCGALDSMPARYVKKACNALASRS